jgi:hypothetical protein
VDIFGWKHFQSCCGVFFGKHFRSLIFLERIFTVAVGIFLESIFTVAVGIIFKKHFPSCYGDIFSKSTSKWEQGNSEKSLNLYLGEYVGI